jgi:hypothetical protein
LHDIANPKFAKAEKLKLTSGRVKCLSISGFGGRRGKALDQGIREIAKYRYPEIREEFPQGVVVGRFPEREIEEPVKLSGAEKKRYCADPDLRVWGGVCVSCSRRCSK